jgi:hypothetical protein
MLSEIARAKLLSLNCFPRKHLERAFLKLLDHVVQAHADPRRGGHSNEVYWAVLQVDPASWELRSARSMGAAHRHPALLAKCEPRSVNVEQPVSIA